MNHEANDIFPAGAGGRLWVLLAVGLSAGALGTAACDLAGIPETILDAGAPSDLAITPDSGATVEPDGQICEPGSVSCWVAGVMRCSDDGTDFEIESCGEHEICKDGACRRLENQCDTNLPFRLSSTEMRFNSNGFLRSDSDSVEFENCSNFEIVLSRPTIRHVEAPPLHREDVFAFDRRSSPNQVPLPPGTSVRLGIEYAPRYGYFPGSAQLRLNVRAEQTYPATIRLLRQIDCVSVPPEIEVGRLERGERRRIDIPFFNCGNQAETVSLPALDRVQTGPMEVTYARSHPPFFVLPPGKSRLIAVDVKPREEIPERETGAVEVELPFLAYRTGGSGSSRSLKLEPRLTAEVPGETCFEPEPFPELTHAIGEDSCAVPGETMSGREAKVRPTGTIDFCTEKVSPGQRYELTLRSAPERSTARLQPKISGQTKDQVAFLRFEPDVPGYYVFSRRLVGSDGERSCDSRLFRVDARPQAPLMVELSWETLQDPIPADVGYGRGVDLNLHVRSDDPSGYWTDRQTDCFDYGLRPGRRCPKGGGRIASLSATGAHPEIVTFDNPRKQNYEIAVRAFNTYSFVGARATIRIWADGKLVENTPITRRIGRTNGIAWLVGRYEPRDRVFKPIDEVAKTFDDLGKSRE